MTKEEIVKIRPDYSANPPGALASIGRISGVGPIEARIAELEVENIRLQRLVAELLLKNQQLRKSED